jgi:hypothetical protein
VKVDASTWRRDTHGLFDFETKFINQNLLETSNSCKIVRLENDVQIISSEDIRTTKANLLAGLEFFQGISYPGRFYLQAEEEEPLWKVIKNSHENERSDYELKDEDVIKLGKARFRVKLINSNKRVLSSSAFRTGCPIVPKTETGECKICYTETNSDEDPLLAPCYCAGTSKYIHLTCLRKCISAKRKLRARTGISSSFWARVCCDVCKADLPLSLLSDAELSLAPPEEAEATILLESVDKDKDSQNGVYMLSMSEGTSALLGRGHECDVRIPDISVSRSHAALRYESGVFYLEDNSSKFGTLVQVRDCIDLSPLESVLVQCGRTVINLRFDSDLSEEDRIDTDQATETPDD